MRICIPITAKTTSQALDMIKQAEQSQADLVELRVDFLEDLTSAHLEKLIKACHIPVIVTPRIATEGGNWTASEDERFSYLKQAIELGVDIIDVEFRANPQMRDDLIALKKDTKVIVSYHDFVETPSYEELLRIYEEEMELGADIGKVVTMAQSELDVVTVLQVVKTARQHNREIIGLCMGRKGILSRIISPFLGAYMTFASLQTGDESAPGQLSLEEVLTIWNIIDTKEAE